MKPKLLLRAPVLTSSGYGVHSRQILRALLASGNYDISVMPVNWGQTPFLLDRDPFLEVVRQLALKREAESQTGAEYDVSVQVTIPNEFQRLARINIGVTAGIEVDRASPEWIVKCNENIDLVIVPSKHSADTLAQIQYQTQDGKVIRLQKPVLVAPEGVDTTVFNDDPASSPEVERFELRAPFNFLCVGLGLDKGMGEDRKNISNLVKWFCDRFRGDPDVGLVLKVSLVGNSLMDFEAVKRRVSEIKAAVGCGEFPVVQIIHGRLTDQELAALYKHPKVKAFVSLTHGEGFGLPLLEAAACGLPVMATNWSGHLDFLSIDGKKRFVPFDFTMGEIPESAVWKGVMEAGSRWAMPKEDDVKLKMKKIVLSYEKPKEWALELGSHVRREFNVKKVSYLFSNAIAEFVNEFEANNPSSMDDAAATIKKKLQVPEDQKTLLYTMPMSAGDVFISTAVVDALKKKYPDHVVFFATDPKYKDILKGNPDVTRVVQYESWMQNVPLCELVFDQVYTPNLAIQMTTSNWVRGGRGRLLGDEMASQCQVEFGDYKIQSDPVEGLPKDYVVLHPGSGKGQWEARSYNRWQEVVTNLAKNWLPVVQVGLEGDPAYTDVIDLRGKTSYNQLASVVQNARCVVSIDSIVMHLAGALKTPHVAVFGSSYSTSTGPVLKAPGIKSALMETPNRMGCEKACYKYQCTVDAESPCVNEIDPENIVNNVDKFLCDQFPEKKGLPFNYIRPEPPKIYGYTHIFNPESQGFPYIESIKSMLGFCEEVVVVDGGSTDASLGMISDEINDPRVKLYTREWDWEEPGMDGMQKAFGRAMCSAGPNDFLWQQDADEVVHEDDYQKIKQLVKRFPRDTNLLHLPVVEIWGEPNRARTDRHSWKWRLSKNDFRVTHGINKDARVFDEKTGKTYAKKGMSDGCEYVDIMTGEYVPHKGFYTREIEQLRRSDPQAYGAEMNRIFSQLPCVFHYSWANLPRKIKNFRDFWDRCWSNLYNEEKPTPRFPDVKTDGDVIQKALSLLSQGGEHGPAETFILARSNPAIMVKWLDDAASAYGFAMQEKNDLRHLYHDEGQAEAPRSVT